MRSRTVVVFLLLITLALGGAAIFIGNRLSQERQVTPEESEAASQEVWDASLVKTAEARTAFTKKWDDFEASGSFSFEAAKTFALGEGARFKSDAPILKAEAETLYGRDLNYYLFFHAYNTYTSAGALTDADVDPIIDMMISDSLVLQKAQELGLVTLTDEVFNSLEKNYTRRNEMIAEHKERVLEEFVETTEGEAIFIWYRNSVVPVDVETGKEVAQRKINELYSRLQSGEIDMKQAADIISNDQEILTKADPTAAANAYYKFRTEKGAELTAFDDPDLEEQLWALGEGQLSQVLVGKIPYTKEELEQLMSTALPDDFDSKRDLYFCIIKVNKRSAGKKYESTTEFDEKEPGDSLQTGDSDVLFK